MITGVLTREVTTDVSMLERLVAVAGQDVVDIGCGGGALVRELSVRHARVVGVEISQRQLAPALARDDDLGASYVIGRAQALPLADASMDLAVFLRTLHHIPSPDLARALSEARRVLRPNGAVYVAEPLIEGNFFALTSLIEDELGVRRAAQSALANCAVAGLGQITTVEYEVRVRIPDVTAFRARTLSVDPDRAEVFDARRAEIAEAFERLGEPGEHPGERWFVQPMRADVLRPTDLSRRSRAQPACRPA